MTEPKLFSPEHVQLIGLILIPIGLGIAYLIRKVSQLIWQVAQMTLKVDLMFEWFSNHGSSITGYREGDEYRKGKT